MKRSLILSTLLLLCLGVSLPSYAYTDAEVEAKTTEIKWLVKLIFSKPKDKEKYQYVFKDIFSSCAKTCKNELSRLASAKIIETYDEDFLVTRDIQVDRANFPFVGVVDWDTIKVKDSNDTEYSVRMIGLDAPESYATRYWYTECYWKEASEHLKELLKGADRVVLETDPTQWEMDKYWRFLAYVFLDWVNINQKMIADWYGWEYTYNLPYKYQDEFKKAQRVAEQNNLWLWSANACNWERKSTEENDSTSITKPSEV